MMNECGVCMHLHCLAVLCNVGINNEAARNKMLKHGGTHFFRTFTRLEFNEEILFNVDQYLNNYWP